MIYDVILLLILGFFAWRGKKRGLVASVLGFFTVILSYLVSGFVAKPLGDMFKNTDYYDILLQKIAEFVPKQTVPEGLGILNSVISDTSKAVAGTMAEAVANIIIYVLSFIIVYLIIKTVLKFINSVFKLPGLNFLNRTGGLILGTLTGFLLVYVVLAVWGTSTLFEVPEALESSYLVKSMFENNLLFLFI